MFSANLLSRSTSALFRKDLSVAFRMFLNTFEPKGMVGNTTESENCKRRGRIARLNLSRDSITTARCQIGSDVSRKILRRHNGVRRNCFYLMTRSSFDGKRNVAESTTTTCNVRHSVSSTLYPYCNKTPSTSNGIAERWELLRTVAMQISSGPPTYVGKRRHIDGNRYEWQRDRSRVSFPC